MRFEHLVGLLDASAPRDFRLAQIVVAKFATDQAVSAIAQRVAPLTSVSRVSLCLWITIKRQGDPGVLPCAFKLVQFSGISTFGDEFLCELAHLF